MRLWPKRRLQAAIKEDGSYQDQPLTFKERLQDLLGAETKENQRNAIALQREGYDLISSICQRRKVHVSGVITSLVLHPVSRGAMVEADLNDGSGTITLLWLGRDQIEGIVPGARISVQGFAAKRDRKNVMYNPKYTLIRIPGDGNR